MNSSNAYYSIIQYCPDHARLEAANIGVLLFCPESGFLKARVSAGNDRIRRFFTGHALDRDRLNATKRAIIERLEAEQPQFRTIEDLKQFIATRANDVLLTEVRPMKVFDPEQDLNRLFSSLVGGRELRRRPQPLFPQLDSALRSKPLQGRICFDRTVVIPVLQKEMRVPYAYENGVLNLVKPHLFPDDRNGAINSASRLAVEGKLLHEHEETPSQLVVIARFSPALNGTTANIRQLFHEFRVDLVSEDEIPSFVQRIEAQARCQPNPAG